MLTHKGTQTLETSRLILRRFTLEDAQPMFEHWANDADVCKYMTWPPHGQVDTTRNLLERWVAEYENNAVYHWVIEHKAAGHIIGSIGAMQMNERNDCCEVGYCIAKAFWGQGLTTEALRAVLGFLFREVGVHRVEALHDLENTASGRVMQKAGMTFEGILRQSHRDRDGNFRDMRLWAILASEFQV